MERLAKSFNITTYKYEPTNRQRKHCNIVPYSTVQYRVSNSLLCFVKLSNNLDTIFVFLHIVQVYYSTEKSVINFGPMKFKSFRCHKNWSGKDNFG